MQDKKRTNVNTLGEFGLIDQLTKEFSLTNKSSIKGVGDDAAAVDIGKEYLLVSTDMLVEGIHFDMSYTPLKHLGYKAVVVNLSDIYAMNGKPEQITVSLAISNRYSVEALEELYEGIQLACEKYKVDLVGGDTTSSPKGMTISITALGRVAKKRMALRSGAKPGDIICATGYLGSAYLGLQILEREKQIFIENPDIQPDLDNATELIERILKPEARKDAIEYFEKVELVPTSMIDISDGLASELHHISKQSNVGLYIEEAQIPISQEAQLKAISFNLDPTTVALHGGEDYELLFTVSADDLEKVKFMPDLYIMGDILEKEAGVKLHTTGGNIHDIPAQGWQHFNKE